MYTHYPFLLSLKLQGGDFFWRRRNWHNQGGFSTSLPLQNFPQYLIYHRHKMNWLIQPGIDWKNWVFHLLCTVFLSIYFITDIKWIDYSSLVWTAGISGRPLTCDGCFSVSQRWRKMTCAKCFTGLALKGRDVYLSPLTVVYD